jgi:hypothetical protein
LRFDLDVSTLILTDAPPMLASLAFVVACVPHRLRFVRRHREQDFGLPDPHSYGSGNPGATNVLRTGNKAAAALTLAGDGGKGFVAVFLAQALGPSFNVADWTVPAVALACVRRSPVSVFHRFAGGKGVATAAGVVFALSWPLGLALAVVWLVMAVGLQDQLARFARYRCAGADRRVRRFRQCSDRVGDRPDLAAAFLAAPIEHPAVARGQGAHDRTLTRRASNRR